MIRMAIAALLMSSALPAVAAPRAFVGGGDFPWTLFAVPDADLFSDHPPNGFGGSLGLALYVEVTEGSLAPDSVVVTPDFMETIDGTVIENVGVDPYTNELVTGVQIHTSVPGIVFEGGLVDAIYAPLGSTYFTTTESKQVLSFATQNALRDYGYGGRIAQAGQTFQLDPMRVHALYWGDFNDDAQVDGGDLSLLLGYWGASVTPSPAGWTGWPPTGPKVDGDDLSTLLGSWGAGVITGQTSTIPEPSSLPLAFALLAATVASRCGPRFPSRHTALAASRVLGAP